ncbi:MAG: DUF6788 family protein [Candidatus Binatia bacterium]
MSGPQASQTRQRIAELYKEMGQILEVFLRRQPLLKGCLYDSRRRCGKPGCVCTKGQLHSSKVLAYRGEGKQQNLYPSGREVETLGKMTSEYQQLRRLRARWVKLNQELLACLGLLECYRLEVGKKRLRRSKTGRRLL